MVRRTDMGRINGPAWNTHLINSYSMKRSKARGVTRDGHGCGRAEEDEDEVEKTLV